MPRDRHQRGFVEEVGLRRKKWRGHYYVYVKKTDGTEKRAHKTVTLGFKADLKKWEAEKKLQEIINAKTGNVQPSIEHTLNWFFENRYWPILGARQKPSSRAGVEWFIRAHVLKPFGDKPLAELDRFELQAHAIKLAETFSKSLVSKFRIYIKAMLDEAMEQGLTERNPARKLEVPAMRKPVKTILSVDEITAVLAQLAPRDRLIVRMFLLLGLRAGELFALRRDDVTSSRVRIDETTKDGALYDPKTTASTGYVWVPEGIRKELAEWVEAMPDKRPTAFLFPSATGTPQRLSNYLRRVLQPAAAAARIAASIDGHAPDDFLAKVNHQVFRRTCATLMQHEATVKDIQAHLRHSTPNLTADVYMQAIPASVQEAVERMGRLLVPKVEPGARM